MSINPSNASIYNTGAGSAATKQSTRKAARTIGILFLTIFLFAAIAVVQGATKFRLGLDLQGGTSVTLQPRVSQGGKVTTEAIDQAVGIIRQRVNSLGVAESEVSAQGTGTNRQIVISVPGETGRRVVDLVGQTAELRFRPVLAEGNAAATSSSADTKTATLPAGVSPEEHWRNERYNWLTAQDQTIVLAHHLDDCVESWVFNMCNGKDYTIPYRHANCIRPFRLTPKIELEKWINQHEVKWANDPSNSDTAFKRNYIRNAVLPMVMNVNPGLPKVIAKRIAAETVE